MKNKGQQEMIGFVLIVVLVVVGLMVFLVISLRDSGEVPENIEIENLLNVLMKSTTECAIVYEPNYDSFEDLFKNCYGNKVCKNLGVSACEYLNGSLATVLSDTFASDAAVNYYSLEVSSKDDVGMARILKVDGGNCTGSFSGAQRRIDAGAEDLIIQMNVCIS
jgi:hypothetical protein